MRIDPCVALLERVGGDEQIFAELCDVFLDDAPKRLEAIREALAAGNAAVVKREAHAFKGAASAFDAAEAVAAAAQLEQMAAAGDLRTGGDLWAILETHSQALIEAVRAGRGHDRCRS